MGTTTPDSLQRRAGILELVGVRVTGEKVWHASVHSLSITLGVLTYWKNTIHIFCDDLYLVTHKAV